MKTCVTTFCSLILFLTSLAQKDYSSTFISHPIVIDGVFNETSWQFTSDRFTQIEPFNMKPSGRSTRFAICHDQNALYVALEADFEPGELNKRLTSRDITENADLLGIIVDPFGMARESWTFYVTPAGVQIDKKDSENATYWDWNAVWESKVVITENQWKAEFRIPFNALRFNPKQTDNFKFNVERFSSAINEYSFWSPVDAEQDGTLNQFGHLKGLTGIQPPVNLSFIPFTSVYGEIAPNSTTTSNFNLGLDAKYVYNQAYTLDVSLIPDFSQTPYDNQVYNVSPFEVKYNEQRQFFVEGTELFDKGGYFYSRRIGGKPIHFHSINGEIEKEEKIIKNPVTSNILNLVKLTGKTKNNIGIGILNGVTETTHATVQNIKTQQTREIVSSPLTNYNALVIDKTFKNNSSVSFINHSVIRDGHTRDYNLSALLLKGYDKNRNYSLSLQKGLTQQFTSSPTIQTGHHYSAGAQKISGNWQGGLSSKLYDDQFNSNGFGYLSRNNYLQMNGNVKYTNFSPKKLFSLYYIKLTYSKRQNYSANEMELSIFYFDTKWTFKNNMKFFAKFSGVFDRMRNYYEPRTRDRFFSKPGFVQSHFEFQTNGNKPLSGYIYLVNRKYLQSTTFTGDQIAGFGFSWSMNPHLSLGFNNSINLNDKDFGYLKKETNQILFGERRYKEWSNQLNADLVFNAKTSLFFKLRHYWTQIVYQKHFELNQNGRLSSSDALVNYNDHHVNFNNLLAELQFKWQFAAGSLLSINWRYVLNKEDQQFRSDYLQNTEQLLTTNGGNSLAIKLMYYLDYNKLKTFNKNKR